MADIQQAIAALEQAREFVKSQHDPTHGPSCQCLDAHDNINKGIAALQALGAARGVALPDGGRDGI